MTFGILALGFPVSPGVPCFGGFGGFCSLWGLTVSLSSLFFPILMHSLGDVWHPGPGVPCFGGFGGFCSLWGLTVSLSSLFFPILMHSLGDVWHPGPGVPCFGGFGGFAAFGGSQPRGRRQGRQPLNPGAGPAPVALPEAFGGNRRLYTLAAPAADPPPVHPRPTIIVVIYSVFCVRCSKNNVFYRVLWPSPSPGFISAT